MKCLLPLDKGGGQPVEPLIESISGGGAARLDVPLPITGPETVEAELVGHFGGGHGVGEVLLVRED